MNDYKQLFGVRIECFKKKQQLAHGNNLESGGVLKHYILNHELVLLQSDSVIRDSVLLVKPLHVFVFFLLTN